MPLCTAHVGCTFLPRMCTRSTHFPAPPLHEQRAPFCLACALLLFVSVGLQHNPALARWKYCQVSSPVFTYAHCFRACSPILPVAVCILTGFIIAEIFFAVYEMAITTILLSFCEDSESHGTPRCVCVCVCVCVRIVPGVCLQEYNLPCVCALGCTLEQFKSMCFADIFVTMKISKM